jgi:uncharacterized protein (DUF1697 family)
MPAYIAMLRGINIGPHKRIKMEKLRASFEGLGFDAVATYIQSGNVVFKTGKASGASLSRKIEEKLLADFGFSVSVILRTRDEMEKLIRDNPLLKEKGIDPAKLHVAFLSEAPTPPALAKLKALTLSPDRVRSSDLGKELHLYFPNGTSGSSLWKHPLDRVLSVVTTTRNWNTVNQLCAMAKELD